MHDLVECVTLTLTQCFLFIEFHILFLILAYHRGEINSINDGRIFLISVFARTAHHTCILASRDMISIILKSGINLLVSAGISISHSHNEIVFVHFPLISYLICSISSFVLNGMDPAMAHSTSKWPCVLDTANVAVR